MTWMDNSKYRELAESGNISGRSRQAMANGKDRPQEEGGIWEYQLGGGLVRHWPSAKADLRKND